MLIQTHGSYDELGQEELAKEERPLATTNIHLLKIIAIIVQKIAPKQSKSIVL